MFVGIAPAAGKSEVAVLSAATMEKGNDMSGVEEIWRKIIRSMAIFAQESSTFCNPLALGRGNFTPRRSRTVFVEIVRRVISGKPVGALQFRPLPALLFGFLNVASCSAFLQT